jgi:hypothetical protein
VYVCNIGREGEKTKKRVSRKLKERAREWDGEGERETVSVLS